MEYSTLLSASQQGHDIKNSLASSETSALIGAGVEFSLLGKAVLIEGRYNHGLDELYKETALGKIKNRVTQVFIGMFL